MVCSAGCKQPVVNVTLAFVLGILVLGAGGNLLVMVLSRARHNSAEDIPLARRDNQSYHLAAEQQSMSDFDNSESGPGNVVVEHMVPVGPQSIVRTEDGHNKGPGSLGIHEGWALAWVLRPELADTHHNCSSVEQKAPHSLDMEDWYSEELQRMA